MQKNNTSDKLSTSAPSKKRGAISNFLFIAFLLTFTCQYTLGQQSLTTTFAGDNGSGGNIFDVSVGDNDITICSFDINLKNYITRTVEVYYKTGTYVGFQDNLGVWTLLGSETVTSQTLPLQAT